MKLRVQHNHYFRGHSWPLDPANFFNALTESTGLSRLKSVHLPKMARKEATDFFLQMYIHSMKLKFFLFMSLVIIICLIMMIRNIRATELRHRRYKRTILVLYVVIAISAMPSAILCFLLLTGNFLPHNIPPAVIRPGCQCDAAPYVHSWQQGALQESGYTPMVVYFPVNALSGMPSPAQTWRSLSLHKIFILAVAASLVLTILYPSFAHSVLRFISKMLGHDPAFIRRCHSAVDAVRSLFEEDREEL